MKQLKTWKDIVFWALLCSLSDNTTEMCSVVILCSYLYRIWAGLSISLFWKLISVCFPVNMTRSASSSESLTFSSPKSGSPRTADSATAALHKLSVTESAQGVLYGIVVPVSWVSRGREVVGRTFLLSNTAFCLYPADTQPSQRAHHNLSGIISQGLVWH